MGGRGAIVRLVGAGRPQAQCRARRQRAEGHDAPPGLDTAALSQVLGGVVTEPTAGEYLAAVAPSPKAVAALTAWLAEHDLPLADLRAGRQHLEDVFVRLTREASP